MMLGVVLCGGESKRMQTDKGLLHIKGSTWVESAAAKLRQINIPVVISINSTQKPAYGKLFPTQQLVIDEVNVSGPLNGLLSVHQQFPDKNLLLLACDMTDMKISILSRLKAEFTCDSSFDFYVYESSEFLEPLCAIYPSETLSRLKKQMINNEMSSYALHKLIKSSKHKILKTDEMQSFTNYNTHNPY